MRHTHGTHHRLRLLALLAGVVAAPLCGGCGSAVARISDGAQQVAGDARSINELASRAHSDFQDISIAITDPASVHYNDTARIVQKAKEGMDLMNQVQSLSHNIGNSASSILGDIPDIQDRVPWWASLLKQWGWIIGIVLVAVGGWYLGIWPIVRHLIASVTGMVNLLPAATVTSAKLDAEALALPTADPVQREAVAARRTSNRDYDLAFRLHQRALSSKAPDGPTPPATKESPNG